LFITGHFATSPQPAPPLVATELERSHDELRGALALAAREIIKLNFGKKDNRVVVKRREICAKRGGCGRPPRNSLSRSGP
jgi:hypothetical protein